MCTDFDRTKRLSMDSVCSNFDKGREYFCKHIHLNLSQESVMEDYDQRCALAN